MPLFGHKKRKDAPLPHEREPFPEYLNHDHNESRASDSTSPPYRSLPKLAFHCQLAHGSRTGMVCGFSNMKQLYDKIADCLDIDPNDILFCTLNSHKLDTDKLLGGQIGLNDFLFAHCKGVVKEVEVTKSADFLGLTITDNGNGYSFVKKVKEGSLIDNAQFIKAGDHIERVNQESMVGFRHFEVARALKAIPLNTTFVLRLVEPLQAGFSHIGPRNSNAQNKKNLKSGRETLRFRSNGTATVEREGDESITVVVDKINNLLEAYMGINDNDLSTQIWELGHEKENPHQFVIAIDNSDLEAFGFGDDIIFDLWGIISDFKAGRLKSSESI